MKKYEQALCTKLGKWWDNEGYKLFNYNIKIEAKISRDEKPFNLKSGFKSHQLPTLIAYKQRPMHWKPSDSAMTIQHYDISCDQPKYTKSYVAIMWIRKGNKRFYLIDPIAIEGLIEDGHKSMDEKMAHVISEYVGELK